MAGSVWYFVTKITNTFTYLILVVINVLCLLSVIPAGALQSDGGLHTLAVSGGAGGAIVQYTTNQDGQFYVPGKRRLYPSRIESVRKETTVLDLVTQALERSEVVVLLQLPNFVVEL